MTLSKKLVVAFGTKVSSSEQSRNIDLRSGEAFYEAIWLNIRILPISWPRGYRAGTNSKDQETGPKQRGFYLQPHNEWQWPPGSLSRHEMLAGLTQLILTLLSNQVDRPSTRSDSARRGPACTKSALARAATNNPLRISACRECRSRGLSPDCGRAGALQGARPQCGFQGLQQRKGDRQQWKL